LEEERMDKITTASRPAGSEVMVPRRFSAAYKLKVLAEIEAAAEKGQIGQVGSVQKETQAR
jgi:hypothetical protein